MHRAAPSLGTYLVSFFTAHHQTWTTLSLSSSPLMAGGCNKLFEYGGGLTRSRGSL